VAPGAIELDVLEPARSNERYWQYRVIPRDGTVVLTRSTAFSSPKDEQLPHRETPAGAIWGCENPRDLLSPAQSFIARCDRVQDFDQITILEIGTRRPLFVWGGGLKRAIAGFAWAPNSASLAVLNITNRWGTGPIELLLMFSGHPVHHNNVFLNVIDAQSGVAVEYAVLHDVIGALPRLLSWSP